MIRVHVAVDHHVVRDAIAGALARAEGVTLIESSVEGVTGAQIAAAMKPDVILACDQFGDAAEEVVAQYRDASPASKIVLLLIARRAEDLADNAGADAVADAGDGLEELVAAIRRVTSAPPPR